MLKVHFIFYSSFRFTEFPHTLLPTHTQPPLLLTSPIIVVYLLQLVNLHWYIIITQRPESTLGFTGVCFMGLDKCIITCIHHYSTRQNSFTPLKLLCLFIPPFLQTSGNHIFLLYPSFAFSRMSHNWNHTVYITFSDELPIIICIWLPLPFHGLIAHFFLALNTLPLYHSSSIHLMKDIMVASKFWHLGIKLL